LIFIERYAKDACILAPNSPAMCGREAAAIIFKWRITDIGLRNGKLLQQQFTAMGKSS